jgi:hypothetical protein
MRECVDEGILQSYFDGELSREVAESVASHLASCLTCAREARELESESAMLSQALAPEFALSVPTERLRHSIDAAIAGMHVVRPERANVASGTPAGPAVRRWVRSLVDFLTLAPQRAFAYAGLAAVVLFAVLIAGIYWRSARKPGVVPPQQIAKSTPPGETSARTIVDVSPSPTPVSKGDGPRTGNSGPSKRNLVPQRSQIAKAEAPRVKLLPGERSYLKTIASLDATIKADLNQPMKPSLQVEYQRNLAMVDQAIAATRSAAKVNPSDPDAAEFMFAAYQSKIDLLSQVADSRLSNRQR